MQLRPLSKSRKPRPPARLQLHVAGHTVEFEARDSPQYLFLATEIRMYVDGRLAASKRSWSDAKVFETTLRGDDGGGDKTLRVSFSSLMMSVYSLHWDAQVEGEGVAGGVLPIANAWQSFAGMTAMTVWLGAWIIMIQRAAEIVKLLP